MRYWPCVEINHVKKGVGKGIWDMPLVNNIWKEASGQRRHKDCYFPWPGISFAAYLRRIKLSQDLFIVKGRMVEIHTHTKTKNRNLWLISLATYGNTLCMKRSRSILISWQLYSLVHGSAVKGYGARNRDCALNHSKNEYITVSIC